MPEAVRIELPEALQIYTKSPIVYSRGETARELLQSLCTKYADFPSVFDQQDGLRLGIRLYINRTAVMDLDAALPLNGGCQIVLVPIGSVGSQSGRCPPWGRQPS